MALNSKDNGKLIFINGQRIKDYTLNDLQNHSHTNGMELDHTFQTFI